MEGRKLSWGWWGQINFSMFFLTIIFLQLPIPESSREAEIWKKCNFKNHFVFFIFHNLIKCSLWKIQIGVLIGRIEREGEGWAGLRPRSINHIKIHLYIKEVRLGLLDIKRSYGYEKKQIIMTIVIFTKYLFKCTCIHLAN